MKPKKILPALTPELNVTKLEDSLSFYLEVLGFEIAFERPEERFAVVRLGEAYFMLEEMKEVTKPSDEEFVVDRVWRTGELEYPYGRGLNFLINTSGVEALYDRVVQCQYPIKMPLETRFYRVGEIEVGVQQFMVMDPDGFLLRFDEQIAQRTYASNS